MGDGQVALILDGVGLAQRARVLSERSERAAVEVATHLEGVTANKDSWLLLRVGKSGRMAVPLSLVSRLEEFPSTMLERSNGRDVVQYRGEIMPIVRVPADDPTASAGWPELLQVVVYNDHGRSVGLVVDEILDIVEQDVAATNNATSDTFLGTAVFQNRVTDLLNLSALLPEISRVCEEALV